MKKDTHPEYHTDAKVTCACGNSFSVGSTMPEIKTEICSMCHPFYTGKQKLIDSAQRVEKFQTRLSKKEKGSLALRGKKGKKVKAEKRKKTARKIKAEKEVTPKKEK